MICVNTAFCDLRADLRIRLATLRKFWFCKLALTCVDLRVRLARALVSISHSVRVRCLSELHHVGLFKIPSKLTCQTSHEIRRAYCRFIVKFDLPLKALGNPL